MNIFQKPLLLTIIATSLGFVIVQIDITIVNIALVQISSELNATISSLQWIIDAYALVFAALLMSSGALGDQFGSKQMFLFGFVIFSVASLACGIAQTTSQLIIFRALQGIGASLVIPNSLSLLNHACAGNSSARARALGLWSAAGGLATAAGPVIGGILVDLIGWRSIFLVNLPVGILGIWLTYCFVKDTNKSLQHPRLDLLGQLFAIIALLSMTASIITAGAVGWSDWRIIVGFSSTSIAGYIFLRIETNSQYPMLPLEFFKKARFSASVCAGFLNNLSYYGLIFILGLFFQNILHYSALQTGLAFLPLAVASISNLIGSRLVEKKGSRFLMVLGLLIASIGYGSLYGINEGTYYKSILFSLIMISFGLGLAIPSMTTALLSTIDQARSGIASAVFTTMRQVGSATGVAIFGTFISGHVSTTLENIQTAFIICSCLSFLAAGISAIWIGQHIDKSTALPE